jgi:superfamily I DNA and/or RNA helicase
MANMPLRFINSSNNVFSVNNWTQFIDVANSMGVRGRGKSTTNPPEASAVSSLVEALMQAGIGAAEILVVSGYASMVKTLRDLAVVHNWSSAQIRTVDKAMGHQKKVVIWAMTKTTAGMGFLNSMRRINVASSRHEEAFYVVGNWDALHIGRGDSGVQRLQEFLRYMQKRHSF